ncbi:hypothetical protein TNCV_4933932 [Trichonephila clavipes]|nr:hypothetical protein TNCV_4933932 [Trichonephila clavipes]
MREANDVVFNRALYLWFSQRRSKGDPISGPLLCEKALELNQKLGGPQKSSRNPADFKLLGSEKTKVYNGTAKNK